MKRSVQRAMAAVAAAVILLFSAGSALAAKVLDLPDKLKKIQAYAFYGNTKLEKVDIPEGVTEIGEKAFAGSSVTQVNLPKSLTFVAEDAFDVDHFICFTPVSESYGDIWTEEYLEKRYPRLHSGFNSIVIPAQKQAVRRYTAGVAGEYSFYIYGQGLNGYLWDSNMKLLKKGVDSGSVFSITCKLSAGQQVYLGVEYYDSAYEGTETLYIEKPVQILQNGSNSLYIPTGEEVTGRYIAGFDGEYTFCTTGSSDTVGELYDSDWNLLASNDNARSNNGNFSITYTLSENQTVYLVSKHHNTSAKGKTTLKITEPAHPVTKGTVYRALLIGQRSFNPVCKRNLNDVLTMEKLLKTVNGGKYNITKKIDQTKSEVQADIRNTFAGADNDDVSFVLYSSHGVENSGYYYGALCTLERGTSGRYTGYIRTEEFAEWLSAIPGKVIVLIKTCGSGAVIAKGEDSSVEEFDPDAFNENLIRAFSEADNRLVSRSGELAGGKFYVMTASMGGETSWGIEASSVSNSYSYFVKWLYNGAGQTGTSMPADTDKNRRLTLNEWYNYVKKQAEKTTITYEGKKYQQHPQVYPTNSDFVVFTK